MSDRLQKILQGHFSSRVQNERAGRLSEVLRVFGKDSWSNSGIEDGQRSNVFRKGREHRSGRGKTAESQIGPLQAVPGAALHAVVCTPMAGPFQAVEGRTHRSAPTKGGLIVRTGRKVAAGEIHARGVVLGGHIDPPLREDGIDRIGQSVQFLGHRAWIRVRAPTQRCRRTDLRS